MSKIEVGDLEIKITKNSLFNHYKWESVSPVILVGIISISALSILFRILTIYRMPTRQNYNTYITN